MGSPSSAPAGRRERPRVAVLVDALSEADAQARDASATSEDLQAVTAALDRLGHAPVIVEFSGDPAAWLEALIDGNFHLVFNLCEGLAGHAAHEPLPAASVELLGIPMTGARAFTLGLCLRKDTTSALLRAHGVPVPDWIVARAGEPVGPWRRFPAIVKPVAEDASLGIGPSSVVRDRTELGAALERGYRLWDRMLIQRFVAGREFNLAIVGGHVLPHAEIDFSALPKSLPRVLTHAAKWEPGSPEERGTVPRCPEPAAGPRAERLTRLAQRVWALVEGTGYGRIDVRLNGRGTPFVIDVNPNPDLSPGAGLARQAAVAGWTYVDLVARIVEDAFAQEDPLARARRKHLDGRPRRDDHKEGSRTRHD